MLIAANRSMPVPMFHPTELHNNAGPPALLQRFYHPVHTYNLLIAKTAMSLPVI